MGIAYNTSIVTNGLIISVDAGNIRSYAGSGNTAYDLTRSNSNYTFTNGPVYNASNGGAFVFDGTNDFLYNSSRMIDTEFQYTSTFTAISWCKITENTNEGYIVNNRTQDANGTFYTGWGLNHWAGAIYGFVGGYPGNNTLSWRRVSTSSVTFDNFIYNKWSHIVYVNTGVAGGQKIYVNGIDATNSASDDTNPPYTINYSGGNHRIYLGYDGSQTHPLTGSIAQVQIYNRALSAQEISQNFNATRDRYGI
jgi:hypothetical protein